MKCPCCGAAELIHDTRDLPYTYKGESTTIPAVTGDFCPACSEVVLNREHGDRYSELIGQFQRQVNAAYVDPAYIASVRKKLDLDQVYGAAARLLSMQSPDCLLRQNRGKAENVGHLTLDVDKGYGFNNS